MLMPILLNGRRIAYAWFMNFCFQFSDVMELLQDMLEKIDRQRRNKMMDEAMDITNNASSTGIR